MVFRLVGAAILMSIRDRRVFAGVAASYALGLWVALTVAAHADRLLVRAPAGISRPHELRRLFIRDTTRTGPFAVAPVVSAAELQRLQESEELQLTAYAPVTAQIIRPSGLEEVSAAVVSGRFFDVLGIRIAAGRGILSDDDREGGAAAAVVSSRFADRLGIGVGTVHRVNGVPVRIVGIATGEFSAIDVENVDLWMPFRSAPVATARPTSNTSYLSPIIRVGSTVSSLEVRQHVQRILGSAANAAPEVDLAPFSHIRFGSTATTQNAVVLAMAFASCIFLLSAANCLFLVFSAIARRRFEWRMRLALGASPAHLLLDVSLRFGLPLFVGMVIALVALDGTRDLFVQGGGRQAPTLLRPAIALIAISLTGLLAPACASLAMRLTGGIAYAHRSSTHSDASRGFRRALMTAYTAGVAILGMVAASVWMAFHDTARSVTGFGTDAIVATVTHTASLPADPLNQASRARHQMEMIPSLSTIGMSTTFPYKSYISLNLSGPARTAAVGVFYASSAFHSSLGIPVLSGSPPVTEETDRRLRIVINRAYQSANPTVTLGSCVYLQNRCAIVEAIVGNTDVIAFGEVPRPVVFLPLALADDFTTIHFSARTRAVPTPLLKREVSRAVSRIYSASLVQVESLTELIAEQKALLVAVVTLVTLFAGLGVGLTVLGLRACAAYSVAVRKQELAVRALLGASPTRLFVQGCGELLGAAAGGIVLGISLGLATLKVLAAMIVGLPDSFVVQIAVGLMMPVAIVALGMFSAWNNTIREPLELLTQA